METYEREQRRSEPINIRVAGSSIPTDKVSGTLDIDLECDALVLEYRIIVQRSAAQFGELHIEFSGLKAGTPVLFYQRASPAVVYPGESLLSVGRDLEQLDDLSDREKAAQGRMPWATSWASKVEEAGPIRRPRTRPPLFAPY